MRIHDDWQSLLVGEGLQLSFCPTLPVSSRTISDAKTAHLIGTAIQTESSRSAPAAELASLTDARLEETCRSWSGRWALIWEDRILLDACGLLGCFYRVLERGSQSEAWASSSPALLMSLTDPEGGVPPGPPLLPGRGMDWYPPPVGGQDELRRLLPSQSLRMSADHVEVLACPLRLSESRTQSYDDALDSIQTRLTTGMCNAAELGAPLWLPLTGGLDSRLLLATASAAKAPIETFTYLKPEPVMTYADSRLPPLLAAAAGVSHRFIEFDERAFSVSRARAFDVHSGRHCVEVDRRYFALGQWGSITRPATIFRGGVFEAARAYYWKKLPYADVGSPEQVTRLVGEAFSFEELHRGSPAHWNGIDAWARWILEHEESGLDWRDRFYIEQRVAGWLSSLEQALDLTGYERVHLANCKSILEAFLTVPDEHRIEARHQKDLIERMAPELLRYGINPQQPLTERVRRELRLFREAPGKTRHLRARAKRLRSRLAKVAGQLVSR